MHAGALKALEFDRMVEAVARLAVTGPGEARLRALRPSTEPRAVAAALAATTEGVAYLGEHGQFPLDPTPSLETALTALAIEGRALEPTPLVEFARFLASVDVTREAIRRAGRLCPTLGGLVDAVASFEREAADVNRKIDASGSTKIRARSPSARSLSTTIDSKRETNCGVIP